MLSSLLDFLCTSLIEVQKQAKRQNYLRGFVSSSTLAVNGFLSINRTTPQSSGQISSLARFNGHEPLPMVSGRDR